MINSRQAHALNPQIRTEAVEWLLRFSEREVDSEAREKFSHWLQASPEHVRAYLGVAAFWQEAGHIDGEPEARDIDSLIARAKAESNVFPLAFGAHPIDPAASRPRSAAKRRLVGIAAALLVAVGAPSVYQHLTRDSYETRIGEQRTINLSDGSTVVLNAQSRVRVRYSRTARTIELDEGQALFKVARNASRPFIVRSGATDVRAVGTQFDVYRRSTDTTVTVVEGKVAVSSQTLKRVAKPSVAAPDVEAVIEAGERLRPSRPLSSPRAPTSAAATETAGSVFLAAGEQLIIPGIEFARDANPSVRDATPAIRSVKVQQATAWTEGLLIFDGAPLIEVIREFNRQNEKRLVLRDASLADLRISGTFPASGSERITRFLEERFSVVVLENDDEILLSQR